MGAAALPHPAPSCSWLNVAMAKAQDNSPGIENWLKLIRADGIGPVTFAKMIKYFGSAERVLGASVSELAKIDGVGFKTAEKIASTREKFDAGAELELARKHGVWLVNLADERYPPVLKRIYDPPPVSRIPSRTRGPSATVRITMCILAHGAHAYET